MRRFLIIVCLLTVSACLQAQALPPDDLLPLPDAPGVLLAQAQQQPAQSQQPGANKQPMLALTTIPCPPANGAANNQPIPSVSGAQAPPCMQRQIIYRRFSDYPETTPMTVPQKGYLAIHNVIDPFNLLTIVGTSAFTIGINSHTAYGPGWRGFGRNAGISFVQDATGEAIGTFAIASLTHEDPHYHRMPDARPMRRALHAISHTIIAHHDDGRSMPNYEALLTYPICAEISNLYVPGIADDGPSTVARIAIGIASDPIDNLITEFLPNLAAHVHLRVIFVQRTLNQVATGQSTP